MEKEIYLYLDTLLLTLIAGILAGAFSYFSFPKKRRTGHLRHFVLISISLSYMVLALLHFATDDFESALGNSWVNWIKYFMLNIVAAGYFTRVVFFLRLVKPSPLSQTSSKTEVK